MTKLLQSQGTELFNGTVPTLTGFEEERKYQIASSIVNKPDDALLCISNLVSEILEDFRLKKVKIENITREYKFPSGISSAGKIQRFIEAIYTVKLNSVGLIKCYNKDDSEKPNGYVDFSNNTVVFEFCTYWLDDIDKHINEIEASFKKTKEKFDWHVNKLNDLIDLINGRLSEYVKETLTNEINARGNIRRIKEKYGSETNYPL